MKGGFDLFNKKKNATIDATMNEFDNIVKAFLGLVVPDELKPFIELHVKIASIEPTLMQSLEGKERTPGMTEMEIFSAKNKLFQLVSKNYEIDLESTKGDTLASFTTLKESYYKLTGFPEEYEKYRDVYDIHKYKKYHRYKRKSQETINK